MYVHVLCVQKTQKKTIESLLFIYFFLIYLFFIFVYLYLYLFI